MDPMGYNETVIPAIPEAISIHVSNLHGFSCAGYLISLKRASGGFQPMR